MEKQAEAFRTISEAADALGLPQHVLRFWETKFPQIKPMKRGGGRRYYRPDDVLLLAAIQRLLYDEGYTIKGVQRILKDQGARALLTLGKIGLGQNGGQAEAAPAVAEIRRPLPIPMPVQMPLAGFDTDDEQPPMRPHAEAPTSQMSPVQTWQPAPRSAIEARDLEELLTLINGCIAVLDTAEA
ncbi:MerR family transcriptional regulator [Roseiarcaceae bacterium H3SJ34-1]|uniref:MerR family transcriptional regulator n=1 Tax=Terripilifer ovatus TaxID=3032367 RepID=UPI003AB934D4|nr:MerR family transcriptional regulator [Roseiarcaceae bacterium H3SJ34-1]